MVERATEIEVRAERKACEIRLRAERMAGELLREIESQHTGRIRDGDGPNSHTRKSAADAAGMFGTFF
jgi:hypothetical protein